MASLFSTPPQTSSVQPRRVVGAGLQNLGNTCFMNSVLQCLVHTVPLLHGIQQTNHTCSSSAEANGGFCCICSLKELINDCLFSRKLVVAPTDFAENLNKISSFFQLGNEEDAQEFLGSLLDTLDNCKPYHSLDDVSIVKQIFGGRLRSQLRCRSCGYCSDTFEEHFDLSLEIDDVDTIKDALASFTKVEPIEDKFFCDGCKVKVSKEKQLKLDRVPQVVTLHLKRFKSSGDSLEKINKRVACPFELDLKPFVSCPEDEVDLKYDLYAVLVHDGSVSSGHYYCTVRTSPTIWHDMDDSTVTNVTENYVLEQKAYLLFYIRQGSSCWLSSLLDDATTDDTSPASVLDNVPTDGSPSPGEASCSICPRTLPGGGSQNVHESSEDDEEEPPSPQHLVERKTNRFRREQGAMPRDRMLYCMDSRKTHKHGGRYKRGLVVSKKRRIVNPNAKSPLARKEPRRPTGPSCLTPRSIRFQDD